MAPSSLPKQVSITSYLVLAVIIILLAGAVVVRLIGEEGDPASTSATDSANDDDAVEGGTTGPSDGSPRKGAAAPDFTLLDVDGHPVTLSQWHGRPVLINFWATWCGPCEIEMPAIQASYRAHQDKGLVVLAVAVDDSVENVRRFFEKHDLGFQPLMDDGSVSRSYRVFGLPTSYFISTNGKITAVHTGVLTEKKIDAYLNTVDHN